MTVHGLKYVCWRFFFDVLDMEDNDVYGDDDLDDVDEEWREEEEEHDEEGDEVAKLTAGMARSMVLTDLPATRSTSVE